MNFSSVAIALTFLCYVGLIYIFVREGWQGNRANQIFTLYLVTMALWLLAYFMVSISSGADMALLWYRVVVAVVSGQFILYYIFTKVLLHIEGADVMVRAGPLVWALTVALGVTSHNSAVFAGVHRAASTGLYVPTFGPWMPVLAGPNYLYLVYAVFNLVRAYRETHSELQRNRIQYLLVGIVVVVIGVVANFVPHLQPYPIDVLANLVNALIIAYAILRYQLLDIKLVIRKGLLYFIPTAVLGAGYFLVIFFALPMSRSMTAQQVLVTVGLAAITGVAVQPLRDKLQAWIDRLFFREKYDSGLMLQRLSRTAASVLDLNRLTDMILDAVLTTMHVEKAAFLIKHEESGEFRLMARRSPSEQVDAALRRDHPVVEWLTSHDHMLAKHDLDVLPQFMALWGQEREDLQRIGAELLIPLKTKDALVGIFAVGRKLSDQGFSLDDKQTLTTLANQTAVAIENARLYEETQRRLRESEMLNRVRESIISALELDKTLQVIMDSAVQAVTLAQKGLLHLFDEKRRELIVKASLGFSPGVVQAASFQVGEGYAGWAFAHQRPIIIADVRTDWRTKTSNVPELQQALSAISVPLIVKGKPIGTITLENADLTGAFNDDDLQLLSAFAIQAAIAIENASLYEAVQRELAQRKRMEQALQDLNATLEERVRQRTSDLQVLYELSQKIGYTLDSVELFRLLLTDLRKAVSYDVAASALLMGDRCEFFVQPTRLLADSVKREIQARIAEDFSHFTGYETDKEQGVHWLVETPADKAAPPLEQVGSLLEVPLVVGENQEIMGLLVVISERADAFSTDQVRLLHTLANQVSVAIQRLRALLAAEQERQESLVERLPEGILLLDAERRIVLANPIGREDLALLTEEGIGDVLTHLGTWPLQQLLGLPVNGKAPHEVVPSDAPHQVFEMVSKAIESGPLAGGWVLVLRDVTERKRAEEDKAKLEEQLRQAQKMEAVGLLAGGVAHEFNNLLTVIQGNAELGLLVPESKVVNRELTIIQTTSQKAARLTHQLLAFSRRQVLQPGVIDLNKLIKGFVEMLERLIGENIELKLALDSRLSTVLVDGNAIEQALMNLAVNARDAMPQGGILRFETARVQVDEAYCTSHREAKPGDYVRVSVVDNGIGMDEATQKRIFEPFFTTKEVGKGTGLGLAMVYGVVKQHSGWIDLYSQVGKGTRFDVYLPVHKEEAPGGESRSSITGVPSGTEVILLAEDELDVRDFTQRVLEGLGYTVLLAVDGEDAVNVFAANQERVRLVILDVVMPKLSGPQAYEEISRLRADVPLLYISGYSQSMANLALGENIGLSALQKPFTVQELADHVRRMLDQVD